MLKGVSFSLNLKNVLYSRPEHLNQQYAAVILKAINHELIDCNRVEAVQEGKRLCVCVYLGVRDDFMRWDKELEEGVLLSWCSGVVRGPSMLTATVQTLWWTSNIDRRTEPRLI